MKQLSLLLVLLLAACGQTEEEQVTQQTAKKETTKKETAKKDAATEEVDYQSLTKRQVNDYLKAVPAAFSDRDYEALKPYIYKDSEAAKYIKKTMPTGHFDRYTIPEFSVGDITVNGTKSKATVTRLMSSAATDDQLTKVITVYDLSYDKDNNTMLITDFNDQLVQPVPASTTKPPTEGPTTEAATTESAVEMTADDARALVEARYRKQVEQDYSDAKVTFTYTARQPEEDAGGTYYPIQAVDSRQTTENLLQSFKVYVASQEIVAE